MGEFTLQLSHLVRRLLREDTGQYFGEPVAKKWSAIASEYLLVIKKPMDLGTIEDRLQNNKYSNPEQVVEDIRLTFANARAFNPKEDPCHQEAVRLLDLFEQRYQELEDKLERAAQKAALQKAARATTPTAPIAISAEYRKELLQIAEMMRTHRWPVAAATGAVHQADVVKRALQDNSYSTNVDLAAGVDKLFIDAKQAIELGQKKKKSDFKELRAAQQKYRKMIDNVYHTSPSTRKLSAMLDALYLDSRTIIFQPPVNFLEYPTYKELIATPMNLDKVRQNVQQGLYEAPNEAQFFTDIQLVWDNCKQFNAEGSDIYLRADECEAKFKTIVKEVWGGPVPKPSAGVSITTNGTAHHAPAVEKKKAPPPPQKHNAAPPPSSAVATFTTTTADAGTSNETGLKYSKKFAARVLKKVRAHDTEQIFFHEVTDTVAPQYSELIKSPMWLGKIETKVMTEGYSSLDAFYADFKLMWNNCAEYNQVGTVYDYGIKLSKEFEKVWKKALKKAQKKLLATPTATAAPATPAPATPIRKHEPVVVRPPTLETAADDEDNDSIDVMHDDPGPEAVNASNSKEEEEDADGDEDLEIDIMSAPTPTKPITSKLPLTPIPPSLVPNKSAPPFSSRPPSSVTTISANTPSTPIPIAKPTPSIPAKAATPAPPQPLPTAPTKTTPPISSTPPLPTPTKPVGATPALPATTRPMSTPHPPTRTTTPSTTTTSTPASTAKTTTSSTPLAATKATPSTSPPLPVTVKTAPPASTPAAVKATVPMSTPPLPATTKTTTTPPIVTTKTPPKPTPAPPLEVKEASAPAAAAVVDVTGQVSGDIPAPTMIISLPTQHVTTRKKMLQEKLARKKAMADAPKGVKSSVLVKKKKKKKALSGHERTVLLHKASHFFARPPSSPAVFIQAIIPAAPNSASSSSSSSSSSSLSLDTSSSPSASLVDSSSMSSSSSSHAPAVSLTTPAPLHRGARKCDLALKWVNTRRVIAKRPLEVLSSPDRDEEMPIAWPVKAEPQPPPCKALKTKHIRSPPPSVQIHVNLGPVPLANFEELGFDPPDSNGILVKSRRQFLTLSSHQIMHTAVLLARKEASKLPVEISLSMSAITADQWDELVRLGEVLRSTEGYCEVTPLRWAAHGLLYNIQTCQLPQPGDCVLLRFFTFVGSFVVSIDNRLYESVFDPAMPWALSLDLRPVNKEQQKERDSRTSTTAFEEQKTLTFSF